MSPHAYGPEIAVIGMAGRFPGAATVDEFWNLLDEGREGFTRQPLRSGDPDRVTTIALPADSAAFDAGFFGFNPPDARSLDPQLWIFLETAWEALEHAGYGPRTVEEPVGVFAGAGLPYNWVTTVDLSDNVGASSIQRAGFGNPLQALSLHVAYKLRLRGPAITVNTACSTSLVAVHLACRGLMSGDCSLALAGGVSIPPWNERGYPYEEGGIVSPDGHCRPFDARSQGVVVGGGAGIVVLKRLEDAVADNDTVYAVIRGSAINNDGGRSAGFTAPSFAGQVEVLNAAYRAAGITPDTITYVQAHGTGTPLGDPIEVRALTEAFGTAVDGPDRCALGSVKSNVGHLDSAAGVAGLIATVLAVHHRRIPGVVHFEKPNAHLSLDRGPFFVNPDSMEWNPPPGLVRRAGVSSFGFGGTNAHVVVEEPPLQAAAEAAPGPHVLVASARDEATLRQMCSRLAARLSADPRLPLEDVAFTTQQSRSSFDHRQAVVCTDHRGAVELLNAGHGEGVHRGSGKPAKIGFLFPGGGSEYPGMGSRLYAAQPAYRQAFDRCADLFDTELGTDLREQVFSKSGAALRRPSLMMAGLVATELAVAELLRSWGIHPDALVGHSLGEYPAAHLAGILDLPDLVTLVAVRGRLCDDLPPSAMTAVPLSEDELRPRLAGALSVASVNAECLCVVSGPMGDVERFEANLRDEDITAKRLPVGFGSHCAVLDPVLDEFERASARLPLRAPRTPVISGVTGTWTDAQRVPDPGYWASHLRRTVRFSDGLTTALADPDLAMIEIGPGHGLSTLVRLHPACGHERIIAPTLVRAEQESHGVADLLANLWCHGAVIDWDAVHHGQRRRRIALPTYPFRREPLPGVPRKAAAPLAARRQAPSFPLPRPAAAAGPARDTAGTDTFQEAVADIWCDLIGVESVIASDNFFHSGGDSLLAVTFCSRVRERLGRRVSAHALLQHPTFGGFLEHLGPAPAASPLLITLRSGAAPRTPLFLVQSIGGTVYSYRALVEHLHPDRPVHAFRALGLEPGESAPTSVRDIAARNVAELLAAHPSGPCVIGGHSSGGLIAHEMARQLLDAGRPVPMVIMLDTVSVTDSRRLDLRSTDDVLALFDALGDSAPPSWQALRTAIRDDALVRAVVVATNQAIREFAPERIATDLLFLRARDRDDVFGPNPEAFWTETFQGAAKVHTVTGNHLTVTEPPHVATVAERIEEALAQADTAATGIYAVTPSGLRINGLSLDQAAKLLILTGGLTRGKAGADHD
ncbi:type I polyketide synthase [Streptomyces spectabilis]|uniref:Acyl transferase domain-containing protein/thioesterase domain-containing protein n=1 Tax=Streptomyces spectabilis TaxID=68270 RepID=A0A7W8B6F6_STRST|nr:type I polyketide synthase [Streptomyces spectabilis]MBB5109702.1 acyl transferase domain-containing protein/thioesterase domain-containing protein [Streptomyces spectabilis]GGV56147.1 hypothetical protein GCM10010245_89020 [Streptomyces spectabilis]